MVTVSAKLSQSIGLLNNCEPIICGLKWDPKGSPIFIRFVERFVTYYLKVTRHGWIRGEKASVSNPHDFTIWERAIGQIDIAAVIIKLF